MDRETSSGEARYSCHCGEIFPDAAKGETADPADARIVGETFHADDTGGMHRRIIRSAAHDRTNQQVHKDCPVCGLDYMTRIYVSDRMIAVYVCKCGYDSSRAAPEKSAS